MSILVKSGLSSSRSDARRNVEQGGVSTDSKNIDDIKVTYSKDDFKPDGKIFKRGKKNFIRICVK